VSGSNVIVRDGGIDGLVVRLAGRAFGEVHVDPGPRQVIAGAASGFRRGPGGGQSGHFGAEFYAAFQEPSEAP